MRAKFILLISLCIILALSFTIIDLTSASKISLSKNPVVAVAQLATSSVPFSAHVLVYHSVRPMFAEMTDIVKEYTVSPEIFEQQMLYLKDSDFHVVSLDDLVAASKGQIAMPSNPVVITFDDGWENQYIYAFPILKKFGLTATFFIFTNAVGHENWMTWDQIKELDAAGMTIGSHTKSHPYLEKITDNGKLVEEITDSKKIIEAELGKEVRSFAYPFGEHMGNLENIVRESGYSEARVFAGGKFTSRDDLFSIKGIAITNSLEQFKKILSL